MSWTLLIQLMILAMWFSICFSMMVTSWGDKRFGSGLDKCGPECDEAHTFGRRCRLK